MEPIWIGDEGIGWATRADEPEPLSPTTAEAWVRRVERWATDAIEAWFPGYQPPRTAGVQYLVQGQTDGTYLVCTSDRSQEIGRFRVTVQAQPEPAPASDPASLADRQVAALKLAMLHRAHYKAVDKILETMTSNELFDLIDAVATLDRRAQFVVGRKEARDDA